MYQILSVDDDATIREGIVQIIKQHFGDEVTVHQAANGLEAVETACAVPVDIIVADIKMPLCSGTEMMERLGRLGFRGSVIIVSGFDDYAFVRKAMKLGADDYILKPVDEAELVSLIKNAMRSVEIRRTQSDSMVGESFQKKLLEQQYRLRQMLFSEQSAKENQSGKIMLAVMDFRAAYTSGDDEQTDLRMRLDKISAQCIADDKKAEIEIIQGEIESLWCIAFVCKKEVPSGLRDALTKKLQELNIRYGISLQPVCINQAHEAWKQAIDRIERHFYDITPVKEADQEYPFDSLQKEVLDALSSCDKALLSASFTRLMGLLCYRSVPTEQVRQLLIELVYSLMDQNNQFISTIGRFKFSDLDVVGIIQESTSASHMRDSAMNCFSAYMDDVRQKQLSEHSGGDEDFTILKIKKMIEENYRTDISLSTISASLELHPNYVSTLFRKKTGMTYSQYLRKVRIDKAKELMAETNLKLYAIAAKVGYKDNAHFYRAFKEETGIPPAHYKKNIR